MKADVLISRLKRVVERPPGHWMACCPAHDDSDPSLSVKEADDGRILIHCFAGCEPLSILQSVGLSFEDIFPEKMASETLCMVGPMRVSALDTLECVVNEINVASIICGDVRHGRPVPPGDWDRLDVVIRRLREVVELVRGRR